MSGGNRDSYIAGPADKVDEVREEGKESSDPSSAEEKERNGEADAVYWLPDRCQHSGDTGADIGP